MSALNDIEFQLLLNRQLCDLADAVLYYHDACGFAAGGDSKNYVITDCHGGTMPARCCFNTRFARVDGDPACQFLGPRGCLNENLECKLYLCDVAQVRAAPECLRALAAIQAIAKMYGLIK